MHKDNNEITSSMGEIADYGNELIKENPMLYILVGSVLGEDGEAKEHLSCVASSQMSKLDPDTECYKVVATALKGVILFLQDALGNKADASEVFTAGLLEALAQTSTTVIYSDTLWDSELSKYGFKRIKEE